MTHKLYASMKASTGWGEMDSRSSVRISDRSLEGRSRQWLSHQEATVQHFIRMLRSL